jgi:hypothetical protein
MFGVKALDALLEPSIKPRLLKIASVDANEVAFGWDLPVESSGRFTDAW